MNPIAVVLVLVCLYLGAMVLLGFATMWKIDQNPGERQAAETARRVIDAQHVRR